MRAIGNGEGFKNKKPLLRKSAVQHYQNAEVQKYAFVSLNELLTGFIVLQLLF
jgi:hypothetical protein